MSGDLLYNNKFNLKGVTAADIRFNEEYLIFFNEDLAFDT